MINEQLRRAIEKAQDENQQLTALLDKMANNNDNQIEQINSQSSEIVQLQIQVQQLKVSCSQYINTWSSLSILKLMCEKLVICLISSIIIITSS